MAKRDLLMDDGVVLDEELERAILVGIDRGDLEWPVEESLAELGRLADTAGAVVVGSTYQRLSSPNPKTFIGSGKAEEIAEMVRSLDAQVVIFDDELSPSQQANLEKAIRDAKIIDRTALVLDIFSLHAVTREGRLQVRLAKNQYLYPRLRGMWAHLASNRMGGGVGSRFGEGESQLEVDRRMVRKRIDKIKSELAKLERDRAMQRKARMENNNARLSLVGYTNAGKSTLINRLTGSDVLATDRLFATLDSTTRKLTLPEGRTVTVTDTVGFIQKLPTTLVEAFKSTLDEITGSNLILLVLDASSTKMESQLQAVLDILEQIDAVNTPMITILNKFDLLDAEEREVLLARHPNACAISAGNGEGIEDLIDRISQVCSNSDVTMNVTIPFDRGDLVGLAHSKCTIVTQRYSESGTHLMIKCPEKLSPSFEPYRDTIEAKDDDKGDEPCELRVKVTREDALEPMLIDEGSRHLGYSNAIECFAGIDVDIEPFGRALVPTGLRIALPGSFAGFAIPSREWAKKGLRFANSPGLIDNGYRGDVSFVCMNSDSQETLRISAGDSIGRIVVKDAIHCNVVDEEEALELMEDTLIVKMLAEDLEAVAYAHEDDNGLDLRSAMDVDIEPLCRVEVPFGIGVEIPFGCIGFVQPRSGLSLREGLSIADSPSIVCTDGVDDELSAIFVNLDPEHTIHIERGERIAQLVVSRVPQIQIKLVDELDETERSEGGFGSSGR